LPQRVADPRRKERKRKNGITNHTNPVNRANKDFMMKLSMNADRCKSRKTIVAMRQSSESMRRTEFDLISYSCNSSHLCYS
jgi:hypothetical protein